MSESNGALRTAILAKHQLRREPFDAPEWGSPEIYVRTFSGRDLKDYRGLWSSEDGTSRTLSEEEFAAEYVILNLVNAAGERIFHKEDRDALIDGQMEPIRRAFTAAHALNKIEQREDIEKNSETSRT